MSNSSESHGSYDLNDSATQMTQDYTALEAELRKRADSRASEHFPPRTFMEWKAADAIATLRRERDEARSEAKRLRSDLAEADKQAEKVEALLDPHVAWNGNPPAIQTAAEAEAATLRARLEAVTKPINMQDVRLAVGEGPLTQANVLAGVNAELRRRAALQEPQT